VSETSPDRTVAIGADPSLSPGTDRSPTAATPAAECPPADPGSPAARPRPGAAASLEGDIRGALADLRRARSTASGSTAPELAHDVELAEWRLNRLLERSRALPRS
jgi:hypothetical protein